MFGKLGPLEILLILVVALLIFGPKKLPQLGRSVGDSFREFKKGMKGEASSTDEEKKDGAEQK